MNDTSPFVSRVLFPVTVMFALSTVGALRSAADAPKSAPTIVVPYGASEYKYQVVPVIDGHHLTIQPSASVTQVSVPVKDTANSTTRATSERSGQWRPICW